MPKFLNNLDLNANQLLNPVIHVSPQTTVTTSALDAAVGSTEGQIFYNSAAAAKKLYYRDDSDWKPIGDILGIGAGDGLTGTSLTSGTPVLNVGAGAGIAVNANDIEIASAQTTIESIFKTDLIIGEDSQTAIDFGTANEIDFKVNNANRLTLSATTLYPATNNQISLGTNTLQFKDAWFDGTVTSDAFAGPLTGNADTATALETSRNIAMTGDVTWNVNFNGTGDVTGAGTIAATAVEGSMLNDNVIQQRDSMTESLLGQSYLFLIDDLVTGQRVSKATFSQVEDSVFNNVSNDGTIAAGGALTVTGASGNFGVGGNLTVTGNLAVNGTQTIINTATVEVEDNILQLNTTQAATDTATAATSGISIYRGGGVTQASLIFDEADDTWDLTNHLTVAGTITGDLTGDVTGNADTASALAASVNINGVAFDGSAGITVAAAAGTLTGTTLASGVVTSSLTTVGAISSGTWTAGVIDSDYLDTDVARSKTFTLNNTTPVVANAGASASTAFTITHAMGASYNYKVEVMQVSDHSTVFVDVTRPTTETIVVTFASAVALGDYVAMVTSC